MLFIKQYPCLVQRYMAFMFYKLLIYKYLCNINYLIRSFLATVNRSQKCIVLFTHFRILWLNNVHFVYKRK